MHQTDYCGDKRCCSGCVYPIFEIKDGGLIRKVCSKQELLPEAYAIAREIADNTPPVSVALIRQMLWRGLDMNNPMDAHSLDSRVILSRGRSSDATEVVVSFIEKRPSEFTNQVSTHMPDFYPWWDEPKYHKSRYL
ncbi:enoyl-CoA hydratase-related protein [Zhongshania sp. BJYM1]|uniref:enoyl-CoA hydratase-related protein n=1 Tax=Zhongshania aquatica TaxID=2965069 RepID=UPI00331305B3